ncbi:MAG: PD-(D/E)XK nuclease family protein [Spirochaetales bacterium]|nr:PD-(D/E)XK nuclease family protein [Spirochaetales bacterium]
MDPLKDIIVPKMEQKNNVFVFPSEVAARLLQKKALQLSKLRTSRDSCFISWDQFKEQTLHYAAGKQPVNNYLRALFTEQLLLENKKRPFFTTLIQREYADNSGAYANTICGFLPLLYKIEKIPDLTFSRHTKKRLSELNQILTRYKSFLNNNRLYEPHYETPNFDAGSKNYTIFYPAIIKDFENIAPLLEQINRISLVPLSQKLGANKPELLVFNTTITEVKWVLLKIAELLDRGTDPAEIVLTVAGLEKLESYLKEQAALMHLELNFHQGKPLFSYSGVDFLNNIRTIYTSGFAIEEIKALIWNCCLPWRQKKQAEELIRFGIAYNCLKNYYDGTQELDIWQTHFKRLTQSREYSGKELETLSSFYAELKAHITGINRAKSFKQLEDSVAAFCAAFFTRSFFSGETGGYFEYAVKVLKELTENAERIDLPQPDSVFNLWLSCLRERMYVPQRPKKGIAVYPYRVSAGIRPAYHFIINASQTNTQHIIKKFPFLHINEETRLDEYDLDLSDPFLALYMCSGEQTFVSYARKDFSDSHLPPGFFIASGTVSDCAAEGTLKRLDPILQEMRLWTAGTIEDRHVLTPIQKAGFFSAYTSGLTTKTSDYIHSPIKKSVLVNRIIKKLPHEGGKLRISPTSLELFTACAFSFFLSEGLGIGCEVYEPELLDALSVGNIIHRMFFHFFKTLQEHDEAFEPDNTARYEKDMTRSLSLLENYYIKSEAVPLKPIWSYLQQNLKENGIRFLKVEAQTFPGYKVEHLEHTVGMDWDRPAVALRGKIDRVSVKENSHIIIDYKKKTTPSKQDIFTSHQEPASCQMPFYYFLLTESGYDISSASYYSFENGGYVHVFNPDNPRAFSGLKALSTTVESVKQNITVMADRINSGDFSVRSQNPSPNCMHCNYRGVCRIRFVLA